MLESGLSEVDGAYLDMLQELVDGIARTGATVSDAARPDLDMRDVHEIYIQLLRAATSARLPQEKLEDFQAARARLDPGDTSYLALMTRGNTMTHREWMALNERREHIRWAWHRFFEDWDILVSPAAASTAFPHDHSGERHDRTIPVNGHEAPTTDQMFWAGFGLMALLPGTVAPAGVSRDGLPGGIQITGPWLGDLTTIEAARLIEREFGGFSATGLLNLQKLQSMERIVPDDLRLLVLAEDPDVVVSAIESRFSGLQITRVADFDMLGGAIASDPHVAYTERFRPGAFPRDILFSQPSLRFVHASGVGVNHLVPWDPARVDVCNAAGVQDEAMAQFAIARLIAMTCHFFRYHEQQKQRIWKPHDALRSTGGTLTVVGLGRIGKACARIAGTLGMTVHGVKARAEAVPGVARVVGPEDINDVLSLSDYVIIVTPLTEATRGLIGREAIAAMKPGVMIHNMSRGGVVDEAALVDALRRGHVRAASLDVFETEPLPATSVLWEMENVHITPHNGIMMTWQDYIRGAIEVFLANLERYINGAALKNVIDPARGY